MTILALMGSPRKKGNTDLLLDQILKAGRELGEKVEKLFLYDHEILPCIDCRKCKKGEFSCPLTDGMREIYPKLIESDLIVFGTPLYWYGPTGKMKLLMDRLRPFVASRKMTGKKAVLVSPSAEGPGACGPLVNMFRATCGYLGMEYCGDLLVVAYEKGEVRKSPEELRRAYEFGATLLRRIPVP